MKCSNCDRTALFEYRLTSSKSVFYCDFDLPSFLEQRKRAGLLAITEDYTKAAQSALESVAFVPEPVKIETEKPKKKSTKKSSK